MSFKPYSAHDLLTSSGKYPDRANSPEVTPSVLGNIANFLGSLNGFLEELGLQYTPEISSGFRTSAANSAAGGAKASNHMKGKAADLKDPDGSLDALVASRPDLMRKWKLFQEHPDNTVGWTHLQGEGLSDRPSRQFRP